MRYFPPAVTKGTSIPFPIKPTIRVAATGFQVPTPLVSDVRTKFVFWFPSSNLNPEGLGVAAVPPVVICSFVLGAIFPIPTFPAAVTVKSLSCWAFVWVEPVVGLSFPPSMLNIPCGLAVLIPTWE